MRRILIGFAAVVGLIIAGLGAMMVFPQITEQLIALTCSMTAPSESCQRRMVAMGHTWSLKGNLTRAAIWYARAANGGNAAGMFHLAWLYEKSGARHLAEVVRDIQASNQNDGPVDFGDPAARPLEPDYQHAAGLYRKAAELGFAPAANNLAELYLHGLLGDRDLEMAFQLHLAAARAGNPVAAMNLALAYRTGAGVTANAAEARKWATFTPKSGSPDLGTLTLARTRLYGTAIDARMVAVIRASAKQHLPVTINYQPMRPDPRLPTFDQVQQELQGAPH
jgi:hypothetical protein